MTDPTTPEGRAELRGLAEKATPGPWSVYDRGVGYMIALDDGVWKRRLPKSFRTDLGRREDAELIVAAVNALPELLDILDRVYALAPTLIEDVLGAADHGEFRRLHVREAARQLREELGGAR